MDLCTLVEKNGHKKMLEVVKEMQEKKREFAKIIKNYPRLLSVDISFHEFHKLKNDICTMLAAHPKIRDYCKDEHSVMDVN